MIVYYIFFGLVGLVIAIIVGINISEKIDSTVLYMLFWMMYFTTIITVASIGLTINYYLTMKNKSGPPGPQGPSGDIGDIGDSGKCESSCRDSICYNSILNNITEYLKNKSGNKIFKLNNTYIKQKIKQICGSDEFKQMAPYNGPNNLIKYLTDIWRNWIDLIINSGGIKYFETIGAEKDWDWVKDNPFDEIKKYDVFYWGMGKEYRPQLIDKCYITQDGINIDEVATNMNFELLKVAPSNVYELIATTDGMNTQYEASFWRPMKFTYKSVIYYPLGDIVLGPKRIGEKFISWGDVGNFFTDDVKNAFEYVGEEIKYGFVDRPVKKGKNSFVAKKHIGQIF